MATYSQKVRMGMVARLVGPNRVSATALANETGIPQPTLSRWLRGASTVSTVSENDESKVPTPPRKRPADWSAEEKLRVVSEARGLDDAQLGEFLRREGLHEAQLAEWRAAALASLRPGKKTPAAGKRVQQLERELSRKEKALAEAAALLVLQKKVRALWGEEGVDTKPKSGK